MRPTVAQYARTLAALAAEGRHDAPTLAARFLAVLDRNGDRCRARAVVAAYEKLDDAAAGRVRLTVTTAHALDDAGRAALTDVVASFFPGLTPIVTERVDPAVLGGVVVASDDAVVDLSVRRRLRALMTHLRATV